MPVESMMCDDCSIVVGGGDETPLEGAQPEAEAWESELAITAAAEGPAPFRGTDSSNRADPRSCWSACC